MSMLKYICGYTHKQRRYCKPNNSWNEQEENDKNLLLFFTKNPFGRVHSVITLPVYKQLDHRISSGLASASSIVFLPLKTKTHLRF